MHRRKFLVDTLFACLSVGNVEQMHHGSAGRRDLCAQQCRVLRRFLALLDYVYIASWLGTSRCFSGCGGHPKKRHAAQVAMEKFA